MGRHKQYTGYRSYQYLDAPRDYKRFRLAKEVGRVASSQLVLSPAEEARVQTLLAENIAISMHDHPVVIPEEVNEIFDQAPGSGLHRLSGTGDLWVGRHL